jgi:hypothetical protein
MSWPLVHDLLRGLHLVLAVAGFLAMPVPLVAKKGGRLHVGAGRAFVFAMVGAALTGLAIAASWIAFPLETRPPRVALSGERLEAYLAGVRTFGSFLAFIGLLTLTFIGGGLGAIPRKRSPEPRPGLRPRLRPLALIVGAAALGLAGLSYERPLYLGYATLGVAAGIAELRFVTRPLPTPMAWWYHHMAGMLAAAITAVTAFAVFGASRWTSGHIPRSLEVIPWLGPTAVGIPAIVVWTRHYKRRFREA